MNENLDLVKVLKDCPNGTKLYSKCLGTVKFNKVIQNRYIEIVDNSGRFILYRCNGKLKQSSQDAEIDLFPSKNQYDWSKWQRSFVDGDVVMWGEDEFAIFKEYIKHPENDDLIRYHVYYNAINDDLDTDSGQCCMQRLATEEEKRELFDAIKSHGYKWNADEKKMEKLIVPKFKVGYRIKQIKTGNNYEITKIIPNYYIAKYFGSDIMISFANQDEYVLDPLDPSKFDITTLKPFDKVLVRDDNTSMWINAFYGFYDTVTTKKYPFVANACNWTQCIPYEGNEHLLGTDDDCDEYYKNW